MARASATTVGSSKADALTDSNPLVSHPLGICHATDNSVISVPDREFQYIGLPISVADSSHSFPPF